MIWIRSSGAVLPLMHLSEFVIRESQKQPLMLVFEDLHWIDNETQAFLDNLVESLPMARMLLLVNYRPSYSHNWAEKTYYTQLRVDPLQSTSAGELLQHLLGNDRELAPLKRSPHPAHGGESLLRRRERAVPRRNRNFGWGEGGL